jgi:hypothetical protein
MRIPSAVKLWAGLAAAAGVVWWLQSRSRPAEQYEVGTYAEITDKIRAGLERTSSQCEFGAPSAEARAQWLRLQEPRKLGRAPLADLLAQPDGELTMEVSSRLIDEHYATGVGPMTEPERNVYWVDVLQGEVSNGGFHQYFANSSGDCAARTREATRAIDQRLFQLYERAVAKFPGSLPAEDRATRNRQMASLPNEFDAWSTLDDEFYRLEIDQALAKYIRAHPESFDSPGQ